jgi:helix-turn-helix protein
MTTDEGADEILCEVQADDYYAIVPEWVLFHATLSHGAVRLYGVLRRFADQRGIAFPGLAAIGTKYGVTPRSVTRHMDELIAAGAVTKKRRIGRAGRATSNLYRVHSRPTFLHVQDDFSPSTTAATTAAAKARATDPDDQRTKMSDGDMTKMSDGPTDKNVRLTTASLNHSQGTTESDGQALVVVSPTAPRAPQNRTTPTQMLDGVGLARRDHGRFKEWLRSTKGARSADAVIATGDPDDIAAQVNEWRSTLDIAHDRDAEPTLCPHGADIALGVHMCPLCDPARPHLTQQPQADRPDWLRDILDSGELPGLADLLDGGTPA